MSCNFDNIYKDMKAQFPSFELKSKETFRELLATQNYALETFDFGYILYFKSDFVLIDYFAIFKKFQSMGYGSKILAEFISLHNDCKGFIFEVEQIEPQNDNSIRRHNFYTKLGCTKLDFKYYFPNDEKVLEMDLFYYPAQVPNPSKEDLYAFIKNYFNIIHKRVGCKEETLDKISSLNF